jgi:hypothetical protein
VGGLGSEGNFRALVIGATEVQNAVSQPVRRHFVRRTAIGWCRGAAPRDEPLGEHRVPVLALHLGSLIELPSVISPVFSVDDGHVKDVKFAIAHRKEECRRLKHAPLLPVVPSKERRRH